MGSYYMKTNRVFSNVRKYIWILTPLVAIGGLFQKKIGLIVPPMMLALVIMSFFKGRYWCGNFCPHGSLYDKIFLKLSRNKKVYSFLKSKVTIVVFFTWFMYNFMKKIGEAVNSYGTDMFLDKLGYTFTSAYLMVLILGGGLSIINSSRSWCRICPMGLMQRGAYFLGRKSKVAKKTDKLITIEDKSKCLNCKKCERVCPMQLAPYKEFNEENKFTSDICIKCSTCVNNCPVKILSLK